MGEITAISWCDHTFNPWIGCQWMSPACDGCYAEALMDKRYSRVQWGGPGKGAGTRVRTSAGNWRQPIRWNKRAAEAGTRPFVFCASLADVFDNQVPREWREDLFELIRVTPHLVWLLLTKRPQNIVRMVKDHGAIAGNGTRYLPGNAAIGTTVEDQTRANINVPALLDAKENTGALFAFLSCEPLLGAIQIAEYLPNKLWNDLPSWKQPEIDWIITGGETDQGGHKARPTHPDWFRSLRDQCAAAGVPFQHKQNGEWLAWGQIFDEGEGPVENYLSFGKCPEKFQHLDGEIVSKIGKHRSGRLLDGVEHNARPEVRI